MSLIRLAFLRGRRGLLDCEASPDPAGRMMTDSLVAGGPPMRAIPCPSNAHPAAEKAARAARPTKDPRGELSFCPNRLLKKLRPKGGRPSLAIITPHFSFRSPVRVSLALKKHSRMAVRTNEAGWRCGAGCCEEINQWEVIDLPRYGRCQSAVGEFSKGTNPLR